VRTRTYEPPCAPPGTPFIPGREWTLAPGVLGWAFDEGHRIIIPMILARREGSGAVGRFLDSLSPRCVVVCVISDRLAAMLARRGYVRRWTWVDGERVDEWRRRARAR
jgi:hypothetical protein